MLKFDRNFIHKEQGSFLVSTLVFTAMISVLIASSWQIVSQRQDKWQRIKILNSRDAVLTAALRNSRVATYFYYTLLQNSPLNADFMKCMIGDDGAGSDCLAKDASGGTVIHNVRLVDDTNTPVIGENTANPVYYDLYGQVCSAPSATCPFEVSASYTVICDAGASACPQAYDINMTVIVQVNSAFAYLFPAMTAMKASQKIAISNIQDTAFPVLPAPTPIGTPITDGAGPGGFIANYVASPTPSPGPSPSPSPTPPGPPPPSVVNPCGAGKGAKGNGSCGKFSF